MERGRIVFIDHFFRPLASFVDRRLNARSLEGYSYGGAAPIYVKRVIGSGSPNGAYLDRVMFRLNPCKKGSLFRTWNIDLLNRKAQLLEEELERIGLLEASHGYSLVEVIPINVFLADSIGPGTRSLFLVYENQEGNGMFDRWSLKERKEDGDGVVCPVLSCGMAFPRMSAAGPNLDWENEKLEDYFCPRHRIYVSPTTFEYSEPENSILWREPDDLLHLEGIKAPPQGKRTWNRMGRENDEDSLTWNTFYYLLKQGKLAEFLKDMVPKYDVMRSAPFMLGTLQQSIFWSVDFEEKQVSKAVTDARRSVGESADRGSEPDLILISDMGVTFIEVKFNASFYKGKDKIPPCYTDYVKALGDKNPFTAPLEEVVEKIGYELMRFFLLGHAMAANLNRPFSLITITKEGMDPNLEDRVEDSVKAFHRFARITWDAIAKTIQGQIPDGEVERRFLVRYLKGKTAGYNSRGERGYIIP